METSSSVQRRFQTDVPIVCACADTMNKDHCTHSAEERCLAGTWVVDRVRKTVEKGYVLWTCWNFGNIL